MSKVRTKLPETFADVCIEDAAWNGLVADLPRLCDDALATVFERLEAEPAGVVFLFADDAALQALNRQYRGQDKPTNVLSFPSDRSTFPPGIAAPLGDVALARETVAAEARAQGKSPRDHTLHLIVHGTLHLLGYDHQISAQAEEMEQLETEILARLGVADPYVPRQGNAA